MSTAEALNQYGEPMAMAKEIPLTAFRCTECGWISYGTYDWDKGRMNPPLRCSNREICGKPFHGVTRLPQPARYFGNWRPIMKIIAHDRESCPICHGRDAQLQLEGFEGWDNPERFKQEIRILVHALAGLQELVEEMERRVNP